MKKHATILKKLGLATIGAGMLLIGSTIQAQTFSVNNVEGTPGSEVTLEISVQGGPTDTAALNFTLAIADGDDDLVSFPGNASSPQEPMGYTFMDNVLQPATGGLEYRGVLYSTTGAPAFDTTNSTVVARVPVSIDSSASPGTTINVAVRNVIENSTGLVGISDSAGNSIVPAGDPSTNRPDANNGSITVIGQQGIDLDFDPPTPAMWTFAEPVGPAGPNTGTGVTGSSTATSLNATLQNSDTAFGLWQIDEPGNTTAAPTAGNLLLYSWTHGTDATSTNEFPDVRLRANTRDGGSFGTLYRFQDVRFDGSPDPAFLPTAGNDKTFVGAVFVPQSAVNGIPDPSLNGFTTAFDVLTFAPGVPSFQVKVGTTNMLKRVRIQEVDPSSLNVLGEVFNQDFTADTSGWTNGGNTMTGDNPALYPTDNGLGVTVTGPLVVEPGVQKFNFTFGFWENTGIFSPQANTIYRVTANISTDEPDPADVAVTRLRFSTDNFSFASLVAPGSSESDTSNNPTQAGRDLVGFLTFPNELAGTPVTLFLDVFQDSTTVPAGNTTTMYYRSLKIEELEMPVLP